MTVVTRNAAANGRSKREQEERVEDEGQKIQLEKGERERISQAPPVHRAGDVICTQAERRKEMDWMERWWPGPFSRISSIGIPTIFIHSVLTDLIHS